jgi:hypothetical protein
VATPGRQKSRGAHQPGSSRCRGRLSGHTYAPSRAGNSGGGNGSKTQKVKHPVSTSEATTGSLRKCVVRNASPRQACSAIRYLLGYLQLAARQGKEND